MTIFQLFHDKKNTKENPPLVFTKFDKEKFKELNEKGYGVYFSVNDFDEHRRKENIKALRYCYADLDIAKSGDGKTREEKEKAKEEKILFLLEYCPPTKIIDTSNGIQPLWKIKDNKPTKENIELYEKIEKGIIKKLDADKGAKDITRVLRMPGFYHQKAEPYMCKVVHEYDVEYTLKELENKFPYKEEVFIPKPKTYQAQNEIELVDFKEVVRKCFEGVGISGISFNENDNVVLPTGSDPILSTYIDHNNGVCLHHGNSSRLLSMGIDFETGNHYTLPAQMLFKNSPHQWKDVRDWYKKEFNLVDVKVKQQLEELSKETKVINDEDKRYTWGTRNLDVSFGLIKPNSFAIIGAKRFSGKTTYTFDIATKNAKLGHKVLYISLEMDTEQLLDDFARKYSGITIEEQFDKKVPEHKTRAYERRKKELANIENLTFKGIRRTGNVNWETIIAIINQQEVDMIFLDNLDLIANNSGENDWDKQKRVSGAIMSFTAEKRIPFFLIHHYRKTTGKGHGMDELSGSGKIADNADIILKISRNTDPDAEYPEKYQSMLYLQKCRGYSEATADIYFIKGTFQDYAPVLELEIEKTETIEQINEKLL